jgi:uncharacterized protein YwgA
MKEQTKKLIAYLKLLGIEIKNDSFESRIKVQKLAYIIQNILGKKLYNFNFYIRGPYSRELTNDYFSYINDFINRKTDYEPKKDEKERLEEVKQLICSMSISQLEIVADLIFLRNEMGLNEDEAEEKLHELRPQFKIEDIWRATNMIKELFLTKELRDKIMKSLKKEIEEWENASNECLGRFM